MLNSFSCRHFCDREGKFDQPANIFAEILKPGITGLSVPEARINLLKNHSELKDSKHFVKTDVADIASALF